MRSCRLNGVCRSLHMNGLSTLSCTWVGRLLFCSIVFIFVELDDGGERPDICCSVLTCITVNWSGECVSHKVTTPLQSDIS